MGDVGIGTHGGLAQTPKAAHRDGSPYRSFFTTSSALFARESPEIPANYSLPFNNP